MSFNRFLWIVTASLVPAVIFVFGGIATDHGDSGFKLRVHPVELWVAKKLGCWGVCNAWVDGVLDRAIAEETSRLPSFRTPARDDDDNQAVEEAMNLILSVPRENQECGVHHHAR